MGDVIGFALTSAALPDGALWISGDTVLYDGVLAVGERLDVDVAIVHLGGVRFPVTGPVRYTMTADEGIELCRAVRPRVAVPVHYEGWSHFRDGGAVLDAVMAGDGPDRTDGDGRESFRLLVLPPGDRVVVGNREAGPGAEPS